MEERELKDDSSAMPYYKHVGSAEQGSEATMTDA